MLQATPTLWHALTTSGAEGAADLKFWSEARLHGGVYPLPCAGSVDRSGISTGRQKTTVWSAVMLWTTMRRKRRRLAVRFGTRVFMFWMIALSLYLLG